MLFISGYTEDESLRRGDAGPRLPFLQKPFSPRTLARAVRELLDGEELSTQREEPPLEGEELEA